MSSVRPESDITLVTGGAGYIGSAFVARLLDAGRTVRVFDPLLYGDGALHDLRDRAGFSLVVGDPADRHDVRSAVEGVARIVHLGALVGDPGCAIDPSFTIAANVDSTRILVDAAVDARVDRFVFASTCSVYGAGDEELDESARLDPKSLYAESKVLAERIVLDSPGIEPVVLRFGTVFGASRRPRFDLVVNLLTAKAAAGEPISIFGGEQWRPFVHVEDIATVINLALDADANVVSGELFNVGSAGENRRLAEIGEIIAEFVPGANVVVDASSVDRRNYRADFSKISARLGFEAAWSLRAGIEELLRRPVDDYRNSVYSNERLLVEMKAEHGALTFGFDRIIAN